MERASPKGRLFLFAGKALQFSLTLSYAINVTLSYTINVTLSYTVNVTLSYTVNVTLSYTVNVVLSFSEGPSTSYCLMGENGSRVPFFGTNTSLTTRNLFPNTLQIADFTAV